MRLRPIHLYVVLLAGTAGWVLLHLDWQTFGSLPPSALRGLAVLSLVGILSEAVAFSDKRLRTSASNSSLVFLPMVAAVLLFGQAGAVLFMALTSAVVEFLFRRKGPVKATFNVSQFVVATAIAGWAFHAIGGTALEAPPRPESFDLQIVPAMVFGFVALAVNHLSVTIAISLTQKLPLKAVIGSFFTRVGGTVIYDVVVLPFAFVVALLFFSIGEVGFLLALAPLAFVRYAYQSHYRLIEANKDLLDSLVRAIETRDPYTSGHSMRVKDLASRIGSEYGLRQKALEELEAAALLHDIGKIEIRYEKILKKPSELTPEEMTIIQSHVTRGVEILTALSSVSKRVVVGVRHHHELWDGTGYPDGLARHNIPIYGRIIKLADAIDAMLSDRPYRKALSLDTVRAELNRFQGIQFDPALVKIVVDSELLEEHHQQMRLTETLAGADPDESVFSLVEEHHPSA
jgi:putative nucleotidyltransferase with HDIG domain